MVQISCTLADQDVNMERKIQQNDRKIQLFGYFVLILMWVLTFLPYFFSTTPPVKGQLGNETIGQHQGVEDMHQGVEDMHQGVEDMRQGVEDMHQHEGVDVHHALSLNQDQMPNIGLECRPWTLQFRETVTLVDRLLCLRVNFKSVEQHDSPQRVPCAEVAGATEGKACYRQTVRYNATRPPWQDTLVDTQKWKPKQIVEVARVYLYQCVEERQPLPDAAGKQMSLFPPAAQENTTPAPPAPPTTIYPSSDIIYASKEYDHDLDYAPIIHLPSLDLEEYEWSYEERLSPRAGPMNVGKKSKKADSPLEKKKEDF